MWRFEDPSLTPCKEDFSIYCETGQRKRKSHSKSQNGCDFCKKRRIKCSEDRPICSNCRRLRKTCVYRRQPTPLSPNKRPSTICSKEDPITDLTFMFPMVQAHISKVLASNGPLDPDLIAYSPLINTYAIECLDHFFRCDRPWLKHPLLQQVMQQRSTHQVLGQVYLLYATLAISAAHLALLHPGHVSYNTLSLVLWQKSLRAYSPCLLGQLESQNADALFFASHLHSMLAFANSHRQLLSQQWQTPAWLLSLRGVKALWDIPPVLTALRQGMWRGWVESCNREWQQTSDHLAMPSSSSREQSQIIRDLRAFCNSLDSEESNIYKSRIRTLEMLETLDPSPEATNLLSWFITRASEDFISSLKSGREMALLLLLHWFRLATKIGQWWLINAAKPEFDRLYMHLSKRCQDERILELLEAMKSVEL